MAQGRKTAFLKYVLEEVERVKNRLASDSLYDIVSGVISMEKIGAMASAPRTDWELSLTIAVTSAQTAATGLEYLGKTDEAHQFYELGCYRWPHPWSEYPHRKGEDHIGLRDSLRRNQLPAAVCNDRVGNTVRAQELYEWAAVHSRLTDEELEAYGVDQVVWERLPWRAYSLACLERWEQALKVAELNEEIVRQEKRAQTTESYQSPLKIHTVLLALCRYQIEPNEETRRRAVEALHPQSVASRAHPEHLHALFYLYNLRVRHPELANPDPDELPPAERARQGYEACLAWMAHVDLPLDGTPESLKVLDAQLQEMWGALNEEKRKTALFLWGSYVGEVVREELAGGQWNFTAENMLAWTLDWELGEVELHLHPYQHVRERARGENEQGLYQLWREIEESYVDFGLAAKYAD